MFGHFLACGIIHGEEKKAAIGGGRHSTDLVEVPKRLGNIITYPREHEFNFSRSRQEGVIYLYGSSSDCTRLNLYSHF